MADFIYNSNGNVVGFIHGKYIHDKRGYAVGQVNGTHVHKLSGNYVGELHKDMVVNKGLGNIGNIGSAGNPGKLDIPSNLKDRGTPTYEYPDVFCELLN